MRAESQVDSARPRARGAALATARASPSVTAPRAAALELVASFVSPCIGEKRTDAVRKSLVGRSSRLRQMGGPRGVCVAVVARNDAEAFLFCPAEAGLAPRSRRGERCARAGTAVQRRAGEENDDDRARRSAALSILAAGAGDANLPAHLRVLQQAASLMPAALAAHYGLLAGPGILAPACMPLPVLFSAPPIGPDAWLANRRARAFHRSLVVCVYLQGAFAMLKFARGDLIGGVYDAFMTAMGAYAIDADGVRMMPSYIMICGFNGVLGVMQVLQQYQGAPLHYLPFMALLPPVVAVSAAYFGWQFIKELRAISSGLPGDGPQDSCFVQMLGGDWWPSWTSPLPASQDVGSASNGRFNPFAGDGHRLGTGGSQGSQ